MSRLRAVAPVSALTDARGDNEKGRPVSVAATGATHGEHFQKPTGASVTSTRASLTSTHPGNRTHRSWQHSLSPRLPDRAIDGAGNERSLR
jgi:hypothetical protein